MKAHCLIPWTNIDIGPRGQILPCCKYECDDKEILNINDVSIKEYTSSNFLSKIKDIMLKNKWPEGCARCKTEEDNNIQSKRQLDYIRWKDHFDNYTVDKGYITASIGFGNTCNLKCITCNPTSSSRWRKEYADLYGVDKPPVETLNSAVDDVYNAMPNLIHFDVIGGEPIISEPEKQKALLQRYVDSGQSKEMTLHYTTNAQQFPDDDWWEIWNNFKEIDMQFSIDGVGERYEYIRYPAKSNLLERTIKLYKEQLEQTNNLRLSVSHTISAYNIYYLDDFFKWVEAHELPRPWCGVVSTPKHMRPSVYPDKIKQQIIKKLGRSDYEDVHTWAKYLGKNDASEYFEKFLEMKDAHDIYRNTNFATTFNELKELIDGI